VILPRDNEKDLSDVPPPVLEQLTIRFVENMDGVLELALSEKIDSRLNVEVVPEAPLPPEPSSRQSDREPITH